MLEQFLAGLMPLLAGYADDTLPEPYKRLLYTMVCCMEDEVLHQLEKTQTILDDAAFKALMSEAKNEFVEAGHGEVPDFLNEFVALPLPE